MAKGPVETRVLNWSPAQSMQIGVPRDPGSSPVRDPKPCQWGVGEQALLLRTCPQLSKVLLGAGHTDLSSSASFCVSLKSWVPPLHFHHSSPDSAPSVQFTCSVYVGTANNWSSFWRGLFCTSLAARTRVPPLSCAVMGSGNCTSHTLQVPPCAWPNDECEHTRVCAGPINAAWAAQHGRVLCWVPAPCAAVLV